MLYGKKPVLYYNFEAGSGGVAYDRSADEVSGEGGDNDGKLYPKTGGRNTDTGDMWDTNGRINGAMDFDGIDDYVNYPTNTLYQPDELTISGWFKTMADGVELRGFAHHAYEPYIVFRFHEGNTTNKLYVALYSTTELHELTTSDYDLSSWHHIVLTSKENSYVAFFVDGKEIGRETNVADYRVGVQITSNGNNIGSSRETTIGFNGLIDEIKIYDYALTANEVYKEYKARRVGVVMGAPGMATTSSGEFIGDWSKAAAYCVPGSSDYCTAPVLELKMDEKKGNTAYDTSGQGNDGNLGGGTAGYMPSWDRGKIGSALYFDGSDDYIKLSNSLTLTDFTVALWLNSEVPDWNGGSIIGYQSDSSSLLQINSPTVLRKRN